MCIRDSFCIDRAGLVGSDGETHQGIFDYSLLTSIPNMSVCAPKNLWELQDMLEFAVRYDGPFAVRYPRGQAYRGLREFRAPVEYGKGEMIFEESEYALLAVGSMVSTAEHIREKWKAEGRPCTCLLYTSIRYGYNIPDVSEKVQERVKTAIETMTGLMVLDVNIKIAGVDMDVEEQ